MKEIKDYLSLSIVPMLRLGETVTEVPSKERPSYGRKTLPVDYPTSPIPHQIYEQRWPQILVNLADRLEFEVIQIVPSTGIEMEESLCVMTATNTVTTIHWLSLITTNQRPEDISLEDVSV
ncbi:hypothetical protein FQN55_004761 [Onygenales sp. PD_40]|nr:hypothetical protein FQN55_004761 [Onygenales sp. PD_40]